MATITIVEYYGEINAEFGVITFGKMPFSSKLQLSLVPNYCLAAVGCTVKWSLTKHNKQIESLVFQTVRHNSHKCS